MSSDEKFETTKVEHTEEQKGTFFQAVTNRYNKVDPHSYLRRDNETSRQYWFRRLGQIKPVELLWGDAENSELRRALNAFQLIFVGIGAIIGTGIFVLSGLAAAKNAGPAVTLSFVIAAVAAGKSFLYSLQTQYVNKFHSFCCSQLRRNGFYDSRRWFCLYLCLCYNG